MHLDAENVQYCLEEFINSRYGQTMFCCHDAPSSIGVTGMITYVEVCGPEVEDDAILRENDHDRTHQASERHTVEYRKTAEEEEIDTRTRPDTSA